MLKRLKKSKKTQNKSVKPSIIKKTRVEKKPAFSNYAEALDWLKKQCKHKSSKVCEAIQIIEETLNEMPKTCFGQRELNVLDLLKRSLLSKDIRFLAKQISYHLMASSELPVVFTDPEKLTPVLDDVIDYLVQMTPRGGSFSIRVEGYPLRGNPGIKCSFTITDSSLKSADETTLLNEAFLASDSSPLFKSRKVFASQGGQLWLELPKSNTIQLNFVLPSLIGNQLPIKQEVFRYDIELTNYQLIRKRFGIQKSEHLIKELERFIKTVVRYPFDIVVASAEEGKITTIYETPVGVSTSVAQRISHKMASENFYIGRYKIDMNFKYKLTELSL